MVRYTADILYDSDTDDEEQLPVAEVIPEPEEEEEEEGPNPCEEGPLQSLYRCRRCEGRDGQVSYAPIQVGICADRQCYDRISLVNWAQNRRDNGQPITIPHSHRAYDGQLPAAAARDGVACGGEAENVAANADRGPPPRPRRGRCGGLPCSILGGKRKKRRGKKSRRKKRRGKKRRRKKTKRRRNRKRRKTKRRR